MIFTRYWRFELAAYVLSDAEMDEEDGDCYHAKLTEAGWKKIAQRKYGKHVELVPGVDYRIKEQGGTSWLPFPDLPELANIRHTWILVRNERPSVPSFCKAPMPRKYEGNEDRNAQIVMT